MPTSVEQAKQEHAKTTGGPTATANTYIYYPPAPAAPQQAVAPALKTAAKQLATAPGGQTLPGMNPQDFVNANRIHVKDGSLFIDPFLVIHPRELAPANEAALRKKLNLTYSINNPSFFESRERTAIALNLGQLIPVSMAAKRSKLVEEINRFNSDVDKNTDSELQHDLQDKFSPFAAIVRDVTQHPASDPIGIDLLKNGLGIYLLVREKMTQNGYLNKLTDYVQRNATPDQVLADLADKIGVTPLALREAAAKNGLDGVGQLLGLAPRYVADVKALAQQAASQDFAYNLVEHWHLGRQLLGVEAPIAQKVATGMQARITAKIAEYRERIHHHYDVPEPVKKEEKRIAQGLMLVDPVQRALLFKLGYEICYSPEINADDIAFYRGIYGLHRKAANDLRDVMGTYRIYFSGRGDQKGSMRTFVHEIAHNLWPTQFTPEEVTKIDGLAQSDAKRFENFQRLMDEHFDHFEALFNAYQAGNDQEKAAVIATTNEKFAAYGLYAEGLFPYLRNAHDFQFAVKHCYDTLRIEGDRYNKSNYNSPQERFREVLSRFAELSQVEYRGEPQFLQFLAPGLNQIWEAHYLPHLARVSQAIDNGTLPALHPTAPKPMADALPSVEAQPKVEQRPVEQALPKVQQQPIAPSVPGVPLTQQPTPTAPQACLQEGVSPLPFLDGTISNGRVAPAMQALQTMGAQ